MRSGIRGIINNQFVNLFVMGDMGLSEEKGRKNVDDLKEWIEVNRICTQQITDIRLFLKDYIESHEKNTKRNLLISILVRCTTNITSIAILSKFMVMSKSPLNLKLSIGILLRNCYMDCLLGLYLSEQDDCHVEEIAEVLNIDYVKAMFDQFEVYRDKLDGMGFDDDFMEHVYTLGIEDNFTNYIEFTDDTKYIIPGQERNIWKAKSKDKIRTLIPKDKAKNELNIKIIWEALKCNEKHADCANNLYAYYKYFSQYEHFSVFGYGNAIVSCKNDNVNMVKAMNRLAEAEQHIKQALMVL